MSTRLFVAACLLGALVGCDPRGANEGQREGAMLGSGWFDAALPDSSVDGPVADGGTVDGGTVDAPVPDGGTIDGGTVKTGRPR